MKTQIIYTTQLGRVLTYTTYNGVSIKDNIVCFLDDKEGVILKLPFDRCVVKEAPQ